MSKFGEKYLEELILCLEHEEAVTARWLHRFDLAPDDRLNASDFSSDDITYLHACAITDNAKRELEWLKRQE